MKLNKCILMLFTLVCVLCSVAGADTLTACGIPQIVADIFGSDGGYLAAGLILPIGEQQTGIVAAYREQEAHCRSGDAYQGA